MPYVPPTAESILQWQDTRGYRLSDRIWNISEVTATQIDDLIAQALGSGQSAVKLGSLFEQFLLPGREFPLTNTPYGTSGSFNARRLSRSEITRANSLTSRAANLANPFVTREYYNLSAVHKPDAGDPCEAHAATSKAQDGWPVGQAPLPMINSHSQCICYLTSGVMSQNEALALIESRNDLRDETTVFLDPQARQTFINQLFGFALVYGLVSLFNS